MKMKTALSVVAAAAVALFAQATFAQDAASGTEGARRREGRSQGQQDPRR